MKPITLIFATLLAGLSAQAFADDSSALKGFYVTGGFGTASIDSNINNYTATSGGLTFTQSTDTKGQAWTLAAGFQLNDNLSIEGGYYDIGGLSGTASITANNAVVQGNTINGSITARSKITGAALYIAPRVSYKLNQWDLFAKAGIAQVKVRNDLSLTGTGTVNGTSASSSYGVSFSDTSTVPLLAVGAQYDLTKEFGVRGEFVWLDTVGDKNTTGESAVKLLMLSGVYRF